MTNKVDCPGDKQIKLRKLDDYYENVLLRRSPFLLKIDVEGHELAALRGGLRMFEKEPPKYIFSEVTPGAMKKRGETAMQYFDFLWSYGYDVYRLSGGRLRQIVKFGPHPTEQIIDILAIHSSLNRSDIRST